MEVELFVLPACYIDQDTDEKVKAYVFVVTLPCSQLSYAEVFLTMK